MPIMTASQALVAALRAEGIRYVFGLPGGHSVTTLYDELAKAGDIQAILAEARENNLAIAAVDDFEARAVKLRDKARENGVNKRYGATSTDMSGQAKTSSERRTEI